MTKEIESFGLSPMDVANWFICNIDRESGDSITHLKLQKLVYYAQARSVVLLNKSIFVDEIQAWAHGPVVPELFYEYRDHGYKAIPICECDNNIPSDLEEVLLEVRRVYGEMRAKSLENLTHRERPWIEARDGYAPEDRCAESISLKTMAEFYGEIIDGRVLW